MQKPVLDRFKLAIDFLLEMKIATKKKEIAASCGITPNYLSGVLHERISLSGDLIQKFLSHWPVNPDYLVSQSDEVDITKVKKQSETTGEGNDKTTNASIVRLINRLKSSDISNENRYLAGDQLNELIAKLVDENINLRNDLIESYKAIKNMEP